MLNLKLKSILAGGVMAFVMGTANAVPLKILVINQSGAYSRTAAVNWLSRYLTTVVGPQQGWTIITSGPGAQAPLPAEFQAKFNDDSLATYNVILFNNNSAVGNVISNAEQRLAFQRWVRKGGGVVAWFGFLDHADLWPFVTDSLLASTKFTEWSSYGRDLTTTKVFWDTVHTGDTVRSLLPEYAALKSGFAYGLASQNSVDGRLTYPDSWMSMRTNPRLAKPSATWGGYSRVPDILYAIDEDTYTVPTSAKMGKDHPLAWAYKLPPLCPNCVQGRFIFNARGHDTAVFSGLGRNAAPDGADTSEWGPTKTFIRESILWAAAGQVTSAVISKPINSSVLNARGKNGRLSVTVNGGRNYEITVYTLGGRMVDSRTGSGFAEYTFSGLSRGNMYLVRVRSGKNLFNQRVML